MALRWGGGGMNPLYHHHNPFITIITPYHHYNTFINYPVITILVVLYPPPSRPQSDQPKPLCCLGPPSSDADRVRGFKPSQCLFSLCECV